ncbi:MAG TPA: VOC family protein [Terriglobales bacterium]
MTADPVPARAFYEGTLGLRFVSQDRFAIVFETHRSRLRVVISESVVPASHTILGWTVLDVAAAVRALAESGVTFERYPGMQQDELGVWTSPSGARIAWFKDPDGNVLSLTQPPAV